MASGLQKLKNYLSFRDAENEYVDSFEGYPEEDYETEAEVTPLRSVPQLDSDFRRIATIRPTSYSDARIVGEALRDGTPVVMNLEGLPEAEAKRMVDFSAGLVFGLAGVMTRITTRVFLLSPEHVEVDPAKE